MPKGKNYRDCGTPFTYVPIIIEFPTYLLELCVRNSEFYATLRRTTPQGEVTLLDYLVILVLHLNYGFIIELQLIMGFEVNLLWSLPNLSGLFKVHGIELPQCFSDSLKSSKVSLRLCSRTLICLKATKSIFPSLVPMVHGFDLQ